MEEQRTLTLDFVKSLMEPSYTLVWTDYNDNLDNHLDIIRKCLDRRNCDCLWEKVDEWYGDAEWMAVREIIDKLKKECFVFNDFDEEVVDAFFDEHEDAIRDEIYSRNDSDVVKDLISYTDDIPIRVEMLSDYDCIKKNGCLTRKLWDPGLTTSPINRFLLQVECTINLSSFHTC